MHSRLLLLLAACSFAAAPRQEISLWPNGAPGSNGAKTPEIVQQPDNVKNFVRISSVHNPSILVSLPPKEKANGMAVVVAPGGGHQFLVIEKEGYEVADWLNNHGIAAFILKYRLARDVTAKEGDPKYSVVDHALPDASRAMRLVRSRAKEFGVDPARIGFMGFSAGGEVAALIETRFDAGDPNATDPIDRASSRPDFAVIVYPGFRSGLITVPKDAPPAFLICADDDRSHVVTTTNLYLALQKEGISSELHVYASGGHGFGLRDIHAPVSSWPDRLKEWMLDKKLLAKQ